MGVTRLRLARFGSRNRPFYRVVAIDSRKPRDAKPIEYVSPIFSVPARSVVPRYTSPFVDALSIMPMPVLNKCVQIGTYDPIPFGLDGAKEVRLRIDRIKYWLAVGAQPSDRVSYLLWRAGLMPAPPTISSPTRSIPKKVQKAAAEAAKKRGYHTAASNLSVLS
jgi:small subunit ribosomal protein S16